MFGNIRTGTRFHCDGSVCEKRADGLGADLVDRHGQISFMCVKRHIRDFSDDTRVSLL